MANETKKPERTEIGPAQLWFGLGAGPLLWASHLFIIYAIASNACQHGFLIDSTILGINTLSFILTVATLAVVVVMAYAGLRSYQYWIRLRDPAERGIGQPEGDRYRFMAFSGFIFSIIFGVTTLLSAVPTLFLSPCN